MRPLTFQRSQDPAGMGSPPWPRRDPWDQEKVVSRVADRAGEMLQKCGGCQNAP